MIDYKTTENSKKELDELLHPYIKKWFYSKFKDYSLPQKMGVMQIHSRRNVLISAPTGATKTLTGFLSILNELVDSAAKGILEDKIYAMYISPLKALNYDIEQNLLKPLAEIEEINNVKLGIRVSVRTGDTTQHERTKMLKKPPHILITTPESIAIMLSTIKFREHLQYVSWVVVDEIHAIADNKRGVHLNMSLERLEYLTGHMTRIGLSATVAPIEEVARYLVGPSRDCTIVDVQFLKQMDMKVLSPLPDLIETTHDEMDKKLYELLHEMIQANKTTLIFTNTRSATERVVFKLKQKFPKYYHESNIGAHHGSLDKEHRRNLESRLREGKLKCVVSSTSLELGVDIGFVDMVLNLGSPKSVARALQRIGRSGHKLHDVTRGRIVVLDRDDLVECSVLLKSAIERKIDRIKIARNVLDVLVQHVFGMALEQVWDEKELFNVIRQSYCYQNLSWGDYQQVLSYLAGEYTSLEDRNVYAKIWRNEGKIGKRGKLSRLIYMTNLGTIPDQTSIVVKIGSQVVGTIDENFLEKLSRGDVFVLGGSTYTFKYSRGTVAQVESSVNKAPTVPNWASEMLPLSFDLASEIGKFRRLLGEKFDVGKSKQEIIGFIHDYLHVDSNGANSIYNYFKEQYDYLKIIPSDKLILIETYDDGRQKKIIFHTLFGRRVNDVLSRAIAYAISRTQHKDVEMGVNDNGFYVNSDKKIDVQGPLNLLKANELRDLVGKAIENTEVFKRRFRHCVGRAMIVLRNYMGHNKKVGRQQVSSMILLKAIKKISSEFFVIRETKREVLEDLMDIESAEKVLEGIESRRILVKEVTTNVPSPFAFNIAIQSYSDILKIDDKMDFLKRMHQLVQAKISLEEGKKRNKSREPVDYYSYWGEKQ